MKYALMLGLLFVPAVYGSEGSEESRKLKHEVDWKELLAELQSDDADELKLPSTSSDAAALQARGISRILQWLKEVKLSLGGIFGGGSSAENRQILELLKKIERQIEQLQEVVGRPDDESVDGISDGQTVDQAQLTLVQWAKTTYRYLQDHLPIS